MDVPREEEEAAHFQLKHGIRSEWVRQIMGLILAEGHIVVALMLVLKKSEGKPPAIALQRFKAIWYLQANHWGYVGCS